MILFSVHIIQECIHSDCRRIDFSFPTPSHLVILPIDQSSFKNVISLCPLYMYMYLGASKSMTKDEYFKFCIYGFNSGTGVHLSQEKKSSIWSFASRDGPNRPYALTSHLHNNDAMLGVKTCRAARTCCAGRVLALSLCPGPGRPGDMACRGWPAGSMLGDGACDSAWFDPQHAGAPFCDVICIRSIIFKYIPKLHFTVAARFWQGKWSSWQMPVLAAVVWPDEAIMTD